MRQQDGLPYSITILATQFYDDNGVSTLPLLDQSQQVSQPDALFGATFSIPYDLNERTWGQGHISLIHLMV
jgi:hypothetical protein